MVDTILQKLQRRRARLRAWDHLDSGSDGKKMRFTIARWGCNTPSSALPSAKIENDVIQIWTLGDENLGWNVGLKGPVCA